MGDRLRHAVRALRHPSYRRFFVAQSCSLVGTWIQLVGVSWLVWRLTHSPAWLGWTGFAAQVPILLLAPFAGVWADRFDRRRLLMVTQTLSCLQSLLLAALVLSGTVQAWHCVVLAGTLGCINAFDTPVRQSFTVRMVTDRQDLPSAIAMNSFMFNLARLLGPSIAGLLINAFSETACFLVNSVSYAGVLVVLSTLELPAASGVRPAQGLRRDLLDGVRYAARHAVIGPLLRQLALVSLLVAPYVQLMPIFAGQVFGGDARTLGLLIGAAGAGAVAATIFLATRHGVAVLPRLIATGGMTAGAALAAFAQSRSLMLSVLLMVAVGAGIIITAASTNTLLQHTVSEDKRGRVLSLYTMTFLGLAPLGSLALGHLAEIWSAPATLSCAGLLCVAGSVQFRLRADAIVRALAER
ncbi:MAG: MFS transporter [Pseudomonadota bacterium]|nr:MFS transporter [Pseudomonadota bacterium]